LRLCPLTAGKIERGRVPIDFSKNGRHDCFDGYLKRGVSPTTASVDSAFQITVVIFKCIIYVKWFYNEVVVKQTTIPFVK